MPYFFRIGRSWNNKNIIFLNFSLNISFQQSHNKIKTIFHNFFIISHLPSIPVFTRTSMGLKENNERSSSSSMLAGAIFMCNSSTMKDCFSQQLFGLPSNVKFLNKIRAGTVLFLFQYNERKLYGVFEATCDGAQNIVPHAFTSSRNFSAQVHFKMRWHCYPLNEKEFYPAIKENYYSYKKFHLDLSGKQVQKLLNLFVKKMKRKEKRDLGIEISSPARSGFEFNQCLVSVHKKKKKQIDTQLCQEFPCHEYSKRFNRFFLERDESYSVIPEEKFLSEAQKHHSFRFNDNDLHSHLQDTCELYENVDPDFPCVQPSAISSRDIIVELPSHKFVCTPHLCLEPAYLPLTDSYASKADMDVHPLQNLTSPLPSGLAVSNTDTGNYCDQTIYESYFPSTQAAFSKSENILRCQEKKFVLADDVQNHSRSSDYWEIGRGQLEEFQFEDNSQRVQYLECNHGNFREFPFENHPRRLRYLETKHDMSRKFQNEMNPNSSQYKETGPYNSREFLSECNFDIKMESDDTIPLNACDYKKKVQSMRLARHERIRHATDVKKMQKSESIHHRKTSVFSRLSITKNVKRDEEDLLMMNGDFTVGQVSKQKNKRENTDGDVSVNQTMIRDQKKPNKSEVTSGDALVEQSSFHDAKQKYKLENKDVFSVDQKKCCDAKQKENLENKDDISSVDQTKCCDAKQKDKLVKTSISESMSCAAELKSKPVSCAVNQKNYMEKTECDLLVDQRIQSKHCVAKKKYKLQNTDVAFSPNPSITCPSELKNKSVSWAVNQENNMEKTECDLFVGQRIQSKHCVAKKKYKLQNTDVAFSPDPSMSFAAKQKNKLKRVEKNGSLPSSLAKQVIFSGHLEQSEGFNFKRRSKIQKENEGEVCKGDECFSGKQQKRKLKRPSFCHDSIENDSSSNQFVQLMDEHISCAEGSSGKQKRRKLTRPSFGYVSCENDSSRNRSGQLLTDHILVPETGIYHVCENKDENTITRNEDGKSMEQEDVLVKKYFFEKPGAEKDFSSPCANQDENVNNRINKFWAHNVLLGAETYAGQVGENDDQNAKDKNQDIQVMDSLLHRVASGTKIDKDENSKRSSPTYQYMDRPILGMECSLYNASSESGSVQVCVNKDIIVNQDRQAMDQQKRSFLNIACSERGVDQVCLNKDKNANQQILGKCPFHQIACAETGFCQLCKNKDKNANRNNQNRHPFDQQILGTKCSLDNANAEFVSCQICENKDGEANIWNQDGQLMREQVLGKRANEDIKNSRVCDENHLSSNSENQDGQPVDQHSSPQGWASHGSANIMNSQVGKCYIDKAVTNNYLTEGSSQKLLVKETCTIFEKCKEHSEVKYAGVSSCKQDGFQCELLEGVCECDKTLEEGEFRSCDQTLEDCESLKGFGFIGNDNEVTLRGLSTDNIEPALALCCVDLPDFHCNLVDSCNTSSYVVTADPAVEISPKKNIKEELDYFHARKSIWNLCDKTSLSTELHPSYYGSDDPFVSFGGQKEVKVEKGLIKHSEKISNEIDVMRDLDSNCLGTEVLANGDCVGEVENSWQYIKAASPLN